MQEPHHHTTVLRFCRMVLVTVHKLNGVLETASFNPQKGSGILAVLKEDYGSGKLFDTQQRRITPEEDVAAGQYKYQVTGEQPEWCFALLSFTPQCRRTLLAHMVYT